MRQITEIIIHCTATRAGRQVSVKEIDSWHRTRGFRCVGYHYIIGLGGEIMTGRPEQQTGAHCRGHNSHSIGVCYVGGLTADGSTPADTRTPQQRMALRTLLSQLRERYPSAVIHGHRDFAAKACPCFDATGEYADLSATGE